MEGEEDYRFGFKIPDKCFKKQDSDDDDKKDKKDDDPNDDDDDDVDECMWICNRMINHFGIAQDSMFNTDQNYDLENVQEFDDAFVTSIVEIDEEDAPLPDGVSAKRRRALQGTGAAGDTTIIYTDIEGSGFVADDDVWESGVVVDDTAFSESICVPGSSDCTDDGSGLSVWIWILLGTVAIVAILFLVMKNHNKNTSLMPTEDQHMGNSYGNMTTSNQNQTNGHFQAHTTTDRNASELVNSH